MAAKHIIELNPEPAENDSHFTSDSDESREWQSSIDPDRSVASLLGCLPAKACYCVPLESIPRSRAQLRFDLEPILPLDAEDMTVDVIERTGGSGGLAVVVSSSALGPVIEQMESSGVRLDHVLPLAFLKIQATQAREILEPVGLVLVPEETGINVFSLREGHVVVWQWIPEDLEALAAVSAGFQQQPSGDIGAVKVTTILSTDSAERNIDEFVSAVRADGRFDANAVVEITAEELDAFAAGITRGTVAPILDLRRDRLAPADPLRPIRTALNVARVAILVMLFSSLAAMWYRSTRYEHISSEAAQQQDAVFREVFPTANVPVGIESRLESEYKRLATLRGATAEQVPEVGDVLSVLHPFLVSLPQAARYRFDQLEFSPGVLRFAYGTAKDYETAETVRTAMQNAGFEVPPLAAARGPEGVTLRFENVPFVKNADR